MAPTTTIGEQEQSVKLSMYAGVDMAAGITIGVPEIAIPVIDMNLHNGVSTGETDPGYFTGLRNFFWDSNTSHANFDIFQKPPGRDSGSDLILAIPGVGGLGNEHFTSFINADFDHEAVLNRAPMLDGGNGSVPPARGANSHYYDVTLHSTRSIPAGMEILVGNVGAAENDENPFTASDFNDVDEILAKIQAFFDKHGKSMDEEKKLEIYKYLVDGMVGTQFTRTLAEDERGDKEEIMEFIAQLFPELSDVQKVLRNGGTFMYEFPESQKSLEWLQENGQCLDGLYTSKSTIPGAEKGAFATRTVKEGGLISPAPLLLIPDTEYMDMYTLEFKGRGNDQYVERKENGKPVTQQLLVNYCFGNPKSSILFYPYGMGMNMINHKPTGKGANAKLVWTNASYHDPSLFLKEGIADEYNAILPLGMDIVATRDIAADEEVFLDYGIEWQQAWDEHIRNHDSNRSLPKEALQWNTDARAGNHPFLTSADRDAFLSDGNKDPIPDHIMTACHIVANPMEEGEGDETKVWNFDEKETKLIGEHWKMCDILERNAGKHVDDFVYTVKVYSLSKEAEEGVVKNVPHKYIRFTDKPYTNISIHGQNIFRHPIGIPEEIFPSKWRFKTIVLVL